MSNINNSINNGIYSIPMVVGYKTTDTSTEATIAYVRLSKSGNAYAAPVYVEVFSSGFVTLNCEFSLGEVLRETKRELYGFLLDAMSRFNLGVAEFGGRINRGHPTHPINNGGDTLSWTVSFTAMTKKSRGNGRHRYPT